MLWKGCLQLFIILGLFGAGLYGIYHLLNQTNDPSDSEVQLIDEETYYDLLDYQSDLLDEFNQLRNSNYPTNPEITNSIDDKILELNADAAFAFIAQNYLDEPWDIDHLRIDQLKGLNLKHYGLISSLIADQDKKRKGAVLNAYLLRDSRNVSNQGMNNHLITIKSLYNRGYFDDQQLAIAISGLPAEQTISITTDLNLIDSDSAFQKTEINSQLKASIVSNLLTGGL